VKPAPFFKRRPKSWKADPLLLISSPKRPEWVFYVPKKDPYNRTPLLFKFLVRLVSGTFLNENHFFHLHSDVFLGPELPLVQYLNVSSKLSMECRVDAENNAGGFGRISPSRPKYRQCTPFRRNLVSGGLHAMLYFLTLQKASHLGRDCNGLLNKLCTGVPVFRMNVYSAFHGWI
jgi:hypothetical protein